MTRGSRPCPGGRYLPPAPPATPGTAASRPAGEGHRHRQGLPRDRLAVTSLTNADASAQDLGRLVREHWSIKAHYHGT